MIPPVPSCAPLARRRHRHHGSRSLKMRHAKGVLSARRMAQAVHDLMDRAMGSPSVRETMARGAPAFDAAIPMLSQLLKAEMTEREVRSISYHMKAARFPAYKDLSGFDFAGRPEGRHRFKPDGRRGQRSSRAPTA